MKHMPGNFAKHSLVSIFLFFSFVSPALSFADNAAKELLELEDCITIALAGNPNLAMSRFELAQQKAAGRSIHKDLFPTLSAQYGYTHQPDALLLPTDQFGYGFIAEQPLYRGKSLVTAVKQAELSVETAKLGMEETINNLVYEVHVRYFALLRAEKLTDEAGQALLRLQSHVKDAKAFYDAGLIPKNDMLQSEVERAQGEQDLVDAEYALFMARSQLNVLLRRPAGAPLGIADRTKIV